jgi:uncharacterized protein
VIVFADTGGWAAFFNSRDQYHDQAVAAVQAITGQAVTFVISDYILDETLTLLRMKTGHAQAVQCGQWLLESPLVRQVRVSEDLWRQAWSLFQQYDDQAFSFTDCVSFVVMRQHKLREAFGFDRHFESMGFRLWPASGG